MQRGRLHVVGIRHHSPACARLVAHTIARLKPAVVLIEGPADMNDRLDELLLPHHLPVAVFSFVRGDDHRATFAPFCQTSPEWQALTAGQAAGADVRFMDLPAWDKAFAGVENRYSDGARRHSAAVQRLCERFHIDGYDALWDHLFEGACDSDADFAALQARLDAYFINLRNEEAAGERDGPREALMRDFIRAALAQTAADDGLVLAVCGGFHASAILESDEMSPGARVPWPVIDRPEGAESYLVPWSFRRLDAFSGYASGMPSPGFYDDAFAHGPDEAIERALRAVITELRQRGIAVSPADVIAARTMAEGLGRLRGHPVLRRTDLLDGLATALVKEALDEPMPWSERGTLRQGTDALLVQVVRVLSGQRQGRLATGTPQPPLVDDVIATLERLRLLPAEGQPSRTEKLRLGEPTDLDKSRVLHRLRLLAIPGFTRSRGPQPGADLAVIEEQWVLSDHADRAAAIIEAAAFGATLEGAAAARLETMFAAPDLNLDGVATILGEAVLVGLSTLTGRALSAVTTHAARETDLARLGGALHRLLGLFRADALFGARHRPELRAAVAAVFERGLWLLEQVTGVSSSSDGRLVDAIVALRDTAREPRAEVSAESLIDVALRKSDDDDAPPAICGGCLGALWSLGALERVAHHTVDDVDTDADADGAAADADNVDDDIRVAVEAVRRMARPLLLGDFLAGLFALAREEVVHGDAVLRVVDEAIAGLPESDFLVALPALRLAFSFFPPREKVRLAERVADVHGASGADGRALLRLAVDVDTTVAGRQVDQAVQAVLVRFGLLGPASLPSEAS